MKRILSVCLVVFLLLSLCACRADEEQIRGEQIQGNQSAGDTQPPSEGPEFSLGSTSGVTYENAFIGIGCNLPEGWSFYTDEQIRQINNITADAVGEEFQELMEQATVVYDMYAVSADGLNNMNVNLEKVPQIQLLVLDLEENLKKIGPTLQETMENMGITDYTYETGTKTIEGKTFTCLNCHGTISGIDMYQTILNIKCNGYLASVTICTFGENQIDQMLENFYLT